MGINILLTKLFKMLMSVCKSDIDEASVAPAAIGNYLELQTEASRGIKRADKREHR